MELSLILTNISSNIKIADIILENKFSMSGQSQGLLGHFIATVCSWETLNQ